MERCGIIFTAKQKPPLNCLPYNVFLSVPLFSFFLLPVSSTRSPYSAILTVKLLSYNRHMRQGHASCDTTRRKTVLPFFRFECVTGYLYIRAKRCDKPFQIVLTR